MVSAWQERRAKVTTRPNMACDKKGNTDKYAQTWTVTRASITQRNKLLLLEDHAARKLVATLTGTVMPRYRVFLGAPSAKDVAQGQGTAGRWRHCSSTPTSQTSWPSQDLEAASRRISKLYENVIFNEDSEEHASDDEDIMQEEVTGQGRRVRTFVDGSATNSPRYQARPS